MKWVIIILLFLILFIYLYFRYRKKGNRDLSRQEKRRAEIINSEVDFQNIMRSSFEATSLYNKLKVKYHPDRFLDPREKEIATNLYQEITANKHDYNKLLDIKEIAEKELQSK